MKFAHKWKTQTTPTKVFPLKIHIFFFYPGNNKNTQLPNIPHSIRSHISHTRYFINVSNLQDDKYSRTKDGIRGHRSTSRQRPPNPDKQITDREKHMRNEKVPNQLNSELFYCRSLEWVLELIGLNKLNVQISLKYIYDIMFVPDPIPIRDKKRSREKYRWVFYI